jgi:uncharacterized YigZ family protein
MFTVATRFYFEEEIKHSRFRARAAGVQSPEAGLSFLAEASDPQATHNCWAYRIGDAYRFSDDGEPGGTAGRPILAAIDGQQMDHVIVVVSRWFGGIKLGAGGLVRAYGGVAAECLRRAPRTQIRICVRLKVHVPFEDIGAIYPVIERLEARKLLEEYDEQGLSLSIELDEGQQSLFRDALRDATRGRARIG